jgi:hypothetical protein
MASTTSGPGGWTPPTIDVRITVQNLRIALPHVGLVILSAAYTIMGAAIFHHFEMPFELESRIETSMRVHNLKQNIIDELWNLSRHADADENAWAELAHKKYGCKARVTMRLRNFPTPKLPHFWSRALSQCSCANFETSFKPF